jgi:endonuclease YncB( thermonuclease family)
MFAWRKKPEGFDWHTYVRTTIKLRREARKDRIDAARQAALDQAHAAGKAVAAGGKAAGKKALKGAQVGAVQGAQGVSWLGQSAWRAVVIAFAPLFSGIATQVTRMTKALGGFNLAGPLALIGTIALISGGYRWHSVRLDAEAMIPLAFGAALVLAALPALLGQVGYRLPRRASSVRLPLFAGVAALACGALFLVGRGLLSSSGSLPFTSVTTLSLAPGKSTAVEGRGSALAGDTLRLNNQVFRLAGVEAPERAQDCVKPGKRRWRCGEQAVSALEAAMRGKTLKCSASGSADAAGRLAATCTSDGKDIAAGLVRGGHVFAKSSMLPGFGSYGSEESEAKRAKAGIWDGEADRPADYRAKAWDEAKKASPDGCPIKGSITSAGKVYILPGVADYRKTSIKAAKGERWFCNEADAVAAGWRLSQRS